MKRTSWNQQVVKKKNKEMVLQTIIALAPLSRADIAQRSGLNKATVSSLVGELIQEELIYEAGMGESSGGRRPVMLFFNERAGYSIGIDIGVNYIFGIVTDLVGNVVHEKNHAIHKPLSFDQQIQLVIETIDMLIAQTPASKYGVIGIGIGVPGIVDNHGKVLLAPNLKWQEIDLVNMLERQFDVPILVENEANAGAYGEKRFGAGQESNHIIYVSAGIGIGVGFILNGELFRGNHGYAGESGHMTIVKNGEKCECGNTGCWEAYASEHSLVKQAKEYAHLADATLEEMISFADKKDDDAIQLFQSIGDYMGTGITNLIKTFNPELVIIGNRLAKAQHWIEQPILESVQDELLPFHQTDMTIKFSKLSTYSTALGVAAFTIEEFLKVDQAEND